MFFCIIRFMRKCTSACVQEYDDAALRKVLQEMTPQNARLVWSSKDFQARPIPQLKILLVTG